MTRAAVHLPPAPRYQTAESAIVDRRRAVRVPYRATFNLRPLLNDGVGDAVSVILQDLSVTGMGIIHSHPLRLGDQYQIPLTQGAAGGMSLVCTVVRCEQLDEGLFSIGFEFNSSAAAIDAGSRQLTGQPAPRS